MLKVAHHARNASKKLFNRGTKSRDSELNNNNLFYLVEDEDEEAKQGPVVNNRSDVSRTAASMIGVDRSIKSFLDKFDQKRKGGESEIGLSQIVLNDIDEEERGFDLQSRVDRAHRGDTIYLPATRIKIESLTINKPVTIIGNPGTVLEISQTIFVSFNQNKSG